MTTHTLRRGLAGLALAAALTPAVRATDEFTIIALPDTQNYVNNAGNAPLFTQQTQWIRDQIQTAGNPLNIQFVTHLGDVVSDGDNDTQWMRADASMSVLEGGPDGVVPYGILPGNHDYASTGNKSSGTADYVENFGPDRFAGRTWYGGADPSGNNSYQMFSGNGVTFMHLALEWEPTVNVPLRDPSPIEWAQSVLSANPGVPVVLSTHAYVDDNPPGRSPGGNALWDQLVRRNDQIIMVLNGHYHSASVPTNDGEYHQVSQNDFGNDVVEVLQDYQDYPNGGDGWLRIITFDARNDEIRFQTYSPVLDQFQTETVAQVGQFASQFTIAMDFDERFQFADPPQPPQPIFQDLVFQEGVDGYTGTEDKEIRSSGGDESNGQAESISVDGDDGSPGLQPNHGLVRFEGVVGLAMDQIAPGTVVDAASLLLNVVNPGSGMDVHQMLVDWDETTTWADLGGDGITPGIDALLAPATTATNVPEGTLDLDVTGIVQSWSNGAVNLGFGLIPTGTNGIDFTTSESDAPPALVVRTLLPGLDLVKLTPGVDGYDGVLDTQIREADPGTSYGAATSVSLDGDDPNGADNHVLIRFEDIFAPGRVPTDRPIVRAWITVSAFNPGDGGTVHRMLQGWDESVTWGGDFGGDGIQADDVEAAAAVETFVVGATGLVEIDVTASLQAWQAAPADNLGWALLPGGGNGWDFSTSETANAADRPMLTVVFDACPADLDGSGDVGIGDLLQVLAEWGGAGAADLDGSGVVGVGDLLLLLGAWGPCPR